MRWLPYEAQALIWGTTRASTEAAIAMASAVPEGRDRGSQRQSLEMKNHPCKVRTATVHELPGDARPRKTLNHAALDQRQPFRVLGVCLDATTTQLNQRILTTVLGFRWGRSGSHSSSHGGLDACELFPNV